MQQFRPAGMGEIHGTYQICYDYYSNGERAATKSTAQVWQLCRDERVCAGAADPPRRGLLSNGDRMESQPLGGRWLSATPAY
jgi:hypothetical protein